MVPKAESPALLFMGFLPNANMEELECALATSRLNAQKKELIVRRFPSNYGHL